MKTPGTNTLRVGEGARLTRTSGGSCVSLQNAGWQHPWFTRAFWWPEKKKWFAIVRPGFVNGQCPKVKSSAGDMTAMPSFLAPVTAWDGAADIAQAAELADDSTTYSQTGPIWVPLYRNPPIVIGGWTTVAAYPAYFTRRGVDATRQLVSCDVVLHKPRLALTSEVTFPADIVFGSSLVTQTLSATANSSDRLRIYCIDAMESRTEQDWLDKILGVYEEPTYDEIRLAKIYLLSPPNFEGKPDGTWAAFVAHEQFWNLSWDQPSFAAYSSDPNGTQWIPPLAGGAASLVTSSIIASINDMTNQALTMATTHSLAGTFWTPTGGGSTYAFPSTTTAAQDSYGLSTSARARDKRKQAIAGGAWVDTLDPVFPYTAQAFSLSTLNWP